jgi:hypothetical protein
MEREASSAQGGHRTAVLLCVGVFLLSAALGILSPGTFDDDDLGRYFYTRAVFESWDHVLSLFVRPAFALLYALPARLGYGAVELTTALISALTCYFVYRTARLWNEEPAELGIVLTGLQPHFLAVSFSALCEPLAALLLASSFHLLETKRMRASALVIGVLPLTRVELAPLLVLWVIRFARSRSWGAIALLPWAVVLWNAAGFIHTGDPMFLWNRIFVDEERTYEATKFAHYLEGYIHVIGPAVFGLSLVGAAHAIRRKEWMIPVVGTIAAIGIYTWLASVSSAGQSAGRLRYLVSISPFFALLALRGFRACYVSPPEWFSVAMLAIAAAVCGIFLSRELVNGVSLGGAPDYVNFYLLLVLLGVATWRFAPRGMRTPRPIWATLVIVIVLISTFRHGPIIALTPERRIMHAAADWYLEQGLADRVTVCNHVWFSARAEIDVLDPERLFLNEKNLAEVPAGSIAVWEPHYGDRHQGDVSLDDLETMSDYRILRRFGEPGTDFFAVALEKLPTLEARFDESGYRVERLGIEWNDLTRPGWRWEPNGEGMALIRGEHSEGAILQLMRVRFARFPSSDAYLSQIESEIATQQTISKLEASYLTPPSGGGVILWGKTRTRGIVVVTMVRPESHEGLRLVGYFDPRDREWMRKELDALLPGLRITPGA